MLVTITRAKSKTNTHTRTNPTPPRKPVWRPQPIGLTRDELRAIVADMLG
jgi:hypothetical protein